MADLAQQIRERLEALDAPPPQFLERAADALPKDIKAWQESYDTLFVAESAELPRFVLLPRGATFEPLPDPRNAAILAVLKKHPHFRATDRSSRHVETLGYPHDFGCGKCHTSMRGSRDLVGLGWCETVADIARALGIEVTDV